MIGLGHVGGLPLEEALPAMTGAAAGLLVARGWHAEHGWETADTDDPRVGGSVRVGWGRCFDNLERTLS